MPQDVEMAAKSPLLKDRSDSTSELKTVNASSLSCVTDASFGNASFSTIVQEEGDNNTLFSKQKVIASDSFSEISIGSCRQSGRARRPSSVSTVSSLRRSPSALSLQSMQPPTEEKEAAPKIEADPSIKSLRTFLWPIAAFSVYAFICAMVFGAPARYSSVIDHGLSITGTWEFALLAKLGDLAFAFAAEDLFNSLAWRRVQKAHAKKETVGLPWFMTLLSVTSPMNLVKMISWVLKQRCTGRRKTNENYDSSLREKNIPEGVVRWSCARLLILLFIVPGTGVILLANIQQKSVFYRDDTISLTGGTGEWEPGYAAELMSYTNYAPEISKWSQDFLRDRAVAWPLDGVTPECKASQHCESYLLAMPYQSIFPWPFAPGLAKDDVDSLSLSSASYYQIDMWDPVQKNESLTDVKPFDLQLDCDKYGTWDHLSIMLCMEMYAPKKYYSIAWKVGLTVPIQVPGQPSRDDFRNPPTFGKLGASLHIAVYRRNARVAFSRTAYRILDVSELSAPILQQFPAQSWFTGLSALFSAPNMTSSSILSAGLANSLYRTSSLTKLERLTVGRERFSNLMAMTLLVHQSNFLANGYNYPSNISLDPMIRRPSPLADEEYMPLYIRPTTPQLVGTYCVAGKRSIPSLATIIAYAIVAGLLVISLFIGKFYTFHFFPVKLSGFTLVDMEALVLLESEEGLDGGTMSDTFDSDGRYNTETIMNKAATLRVRLRERA